MERRHEPELKKPPVLPLLLLHFTLIKVLETMIEEKKPNYLQEDLFNQKIFQRELS
jgi:hypothetical protein